jgi:hypothetical protein
MAKRKFCYILSCLISYTTHVTGTPFHKKKNDFLLYGLFRKLNDPISNKNKIAL